MATVRFGDFEWDDEKARANARKHGITFEEAATSFADPRGIEAPDFSEPNRFVLVAISAASRVLFVVYAERTPRATLRIISARKASPTQRKRYEE